LNKEYVRYLNEATPDWIISKQNVKIAGMMISKEIKELFDWELLKLRRAFCYDDTYEERTNNPELEKLDVYFMVDKEVL
jgi:hypothetical protein